MKKIVIASDSFKGSLSSMQVAESVERGVLNVFPGCEIVKLAAGLPEALRGADLVITGEGRIDAQTLNGKVPAEVLILARQAGVPAAVIAGAVEDRGQLEKAGFTRIRDINDGYSGGGNVMDAGIASLNIESTVSDMMREIGKNI